MEVSKHNKKGGDGMLNKLIKLLEVKKLIALVVVVVFCIMSLRGDIDKNEFMTVLTMIVSFYFMQSSLRASVQENK